MSDKKFQLEILTPDRVFFSGQVQSLTIATPTGEMGIMYHTLPLVTILQEGTLRILQSEKWMEAFSADGFVRVGRDKVTILAQTCEWPYEISEEKTSLEMTGLTDKMKKAQSIKEYRMAKAQLAIQLAKLRIKKKNL